MMRYISGYRVAQCTCRPPRSCNAVLHVRDTHAWHAPTSLCQAASKYTADDSIDESTQVPASTLLTPDAAAHFAATGSAAAGHHSSTSPPWTTSWQMREQSILWNDELKLRLLKRAVAAELSMDEQEFAERLEGLSVLLPDLASLLHKGPNKMVTQLAANTNKVAQRLLRLRGILPEANISQLVSMRLSLLLEDDLDDVAAAVTQLRVLLPSDIPVDAFVQLYPQVLDVKDFEQAMKDAQLMMPRLDLTQTLRTNPDLILGLQKGRHLIPYELPNQ